MKENKLTRRTFFGRTFSCLPLALAVSSGLTAFTPFPKGGDRDLAAAMPAGLSDAEVLKKMLAAKNPLKWVFTGDSITQGAKHTDGYRSYPEIFGERVRWEMGRGRDFMINTAISGHTSQQLLDDFDWRVGQFNPQLVSVMIGTNDAANQKVSLANFEDNLNQLIFRIRQTGALPVFHTPNIIIEAKATERKHLSAYVTVIRKVADRQAVILVDHWGYWKTTLETNAPEDVHNKWLKDPLHPNGRGHLELARLSFKALAIFDPRSFTCSGKINES